MKAAAPADGAAGRAEPGFGARGERFIDGLLVRRPYGERAGEKQKCERGAGATDGHGGSSWWRNVGERNEV